MMSLKLRLLRKLQNQIQYLIWKCPEETLLSECKACIEDGREHSAIRSQLESIYGKHSQEIRDLEMLVRLQAFRVSRSGQ